jgi:hypothetical protein
MKKIFCWLYPLLFAACGLANPVGVNPSTDKELFAVAEVSRLSALLHNPHSADFRVETLKIPGGVQGCPIEINFCNAAAWYGPGKVVHFWQSFVNRESTTFRNLTDIAAHEVCHSMTPNHDQLLWNCIRTIGGDPQFVPRD